MGRSHPPAPQLAENSRGVWLNHPGVAIDAHHSPVIVAHRANVDGPSPLENTTQAIAAAAAAGADAVELDVRRTRDGCLVLAHDATRWRRWNGVGVPGVPIRWTRRRRVPFLAGLEEALACAISLSLQVKFDVKYAPAVPDVRSYCRKYGVDPARVALWCRSMTYTADRANRDVFGEVALLAKRQNADDYVRAAVRAGASAVSLDPGLLTAASVSAARDEGLTVYAWIVDRDRHRQAVDLGVDGLVTDWIARARGSRG